MDKQEALGCSLLPLWLVPASLKTLRLGKFQGICWVIEPTISKGDNPKAHIN